MTRDSQPSFWTEASLSVRPEAVEAVAEALRDATGCGVSIEPPIESLGPDEGFVLDQQAPVVLRAYMPGEVAPSRRRSLVRRLRSGSLAGAVVGELSWRTIREEDWAEAWKAYYNVERAGCIAVRPAWREYTPLPGEVVVTVDPGMAFGTGQHATTRMCLLALQDLVRPDAHILDYGCGSGVLALAALLMGARDAVCVDIEEQAVRATAANAALNGVEDRVDVRLGGIEAAGDGPFDLVLGNIIAGTLIRSAGDMAARMKPGAALVASGIVAERLGHVVDAFEDAGLQVERLLEEGDWRAVVARRAAGE